MLSKKLKKEIINIVVNEFSFNQIQNLTCWINDLKFNEPIRIYRWSHNRYNDKILLNGYYLNKFFKLPVLNDSPKGGMEGDYISLKNNKENRDKIEFIKSFLDIY